MQADEMGRVGLFDDGQWNQGDSAVRPFRYIRAHDVARAVELARDPEASFIAGGTSFVDLMKLDVETPGLTIDVSRLPDLGRIDEVPDGGGGPSLRIGAMARNSEVADSALIGERYPLVREALMSGASPQLRNLATVGGNLLQRTRCPYFRDVSFEACNKRSPGSGCSAIHGYNRGHAVLGGSESCIATHPSDLCVALVALDAVVQTVGQDGERSVPVREFYRMPGDSPQLENVLGHGELITAVVLPSSSARFAGGSHYLKLRDRSSFDFALVSVAVALQIENGRIGDARIALGGVATVPWRALSAERALVGAPPSDSSFLLAATAAMEGAIPRQHNAFKIELAKRSIVRALSTAASGTGGETGTSA
jgi:xanthine dehydrogenase YagS FAD-binding subunit